MSLMFYEPGSILFFQYWFFLLYLFPYFLIQVNSGGAAVCRCLPGWNHEPGKSTIDGCPRRIQEKEVR